MAWEVGPQSQGEGGCLNGLKEAPKEDIMKDYTGTVEDLE